MGMLGPGAFLSFTRFDDEHSQGRLSGLCKLISEEVRAQTGEVFHVFQDREDVHWGENWRARMVNSLDNITFLIPIITPTFFRDRRCRKELDRFLMRESKLGRQDLVLPIYYIQCAELQETNPDPLARVLASRQFSDWRDLRFASLNAGRLRLAISRLGDLIRSARERVTVPSSFCRDIAYDNMSYHYSRIPLDAVFLRRTEAADPLESTDGADTPADSSVEMDIPEIGVVPEIDSFDQVASDGEMELVENLITAPVDLDLVDLSEVIEEVAGEKIALKAGVWPFQGTGRESSGHKTFPSIPFKRESRTHIVDPRNGPYTSISEAMAVAAPGDLIRVRPGVYRENLVIEKPLRIVGDGRREDIVVESVDGDALLFRAEYGHVSGLTLRQIGNKRVFAVEVLKGRLELEECDISSESLSCVAIHGGANPHLVRNRIHHGGQSGIIVLGDGRGLIEGNEITHNTYSGVLVVKGGSPLVRRNRISENQMHGVWVFDNGGGNFENNDLRMNQGVALDISPDSRANVLCVGNLVS